MCVEQRFDLCRPHLEAGCIDHALQSFDEEEVAVFVDAPEVAGAQEAFAVEREEAAGVLGGVVPVRIEHLGAVNDDFADRTLRQLRQRLRVNDACVRVEHWNAEALCLRPVAGIHV